MAEDSTQRPVAAAAISDQGAVSDATAVTGPSPGYLAVKRGLDVVLGGLLLLISLPLLLVLGLAVRLDSPGPAFFRQDRVGRGGTVFTIFKLRSMTRHAPAYSYKIPQDDPRITRVGGWLRRTGLDELPQLLNVVRGDMSLIGPRPELPFIVEQCQMWEHSRLSVRPGITGWWQIHHRDDIPLHLNLEYDNFYLANLSPSLDWQIACRTIQVMLKGAAAPAPQPIAEPRTDSQTP